MVQGHRQTTGEIRGWGCVPRCLRGTNNKKGTNAELRPFSQALDDKEQFSCGAQRAPQLLATKADHVNALILSKPRRLYLVLFQCPLLDNDNDNDTLKEVPHPSNEGLALQARVSGPWPHKKESVLLVELARRQGVQTQTVNGQSAMQQVLR